MANFIFNEGATLMSTVGLDWVNTPYDCALIDDSLGFEPTSANVWADLSSASTAFEIFNNRSVTTSGAVSADPIQFVNASPMNPDGRFLGFVIKRDSDDALIAWFDEGFTQLGPQSNSVSIGNILGVAIQSATYTFTLRPGINNEEAWFRP